MGALDKAKQIYGSTLFRVEDVTSENREQQREGQQDEEQPAHPAVLRPEVVTVDRGLAGACAGSESHNFLTGFN
ncbi:MAG: hypothetical protein D6761_12340 [Candidatus Dadabacteria bacterium]|nr:MAG: hypothetical protein D6761_12340 [Candidatus Dadabacteria bacterium]